MYIESHCRYRYTKSKDAGQTITKLSSLSEPQLHLESQSLTQATPSQKKKKFKQNRTNTYKETCLHFRRPCPPLKIFHDDTGQLISIWELILSLFWPPLLKAALIYMLIFLIAFYTLPVIHTRFSLSHWFLFLLTDHGYEGFIYLFIFSFFWGVLSGTGRDTRMSFITYFLM